MDLLSSKELARVTHLDRFGGEILSKILMQILKFNKVNNLYSEYSDQSGLDFIQSIIDRLELKFEIREEDLKRIPADQPFIIIANHPFGGIDALLLMKFIAEQRSDFKVMANFLLHKIEPLKELFFPVNPFENHKGAKSSFTGIKHAMKHLEEGKCLGIFPAGEVSSYQPESGVIQDREWQSSILKFIKHAKVPVVPVYFGGTNSRLFHILGQIHPVLRTAKLPSELFNKKNKTIKIRIGMPVPVSEQNEFDNIAHYGRYLRARTYALGSAMEVKKFYFKELSPKLRKVHPVVDPVEPSIVMQEIEMLKKDFLLFENKNYKIICAPSTEMPNLIYELGRLRELTFREVGEGTNRGIDIDEYDLYYHQLVIWDDEESKIVGAYRLGKGKDIIAQYGLSGFYITSLFKMKKKFNAVMNESIELGRSFIVKDYQRKPLPLFLLWKGILFFLLKNPDYRYLIGPVSISNDFSKFSKGLIVEFIRNYYFDEEKAQYIKPRKKFVVKTNPRVDTKLFLETSNNVSKLDKLIQDIEATYKFPILLKKYLQLNAKLIGFNIDPKFNNALDGLLILDIFDVPQEFVKALSKELNDDSILKRFNFGPVESILE